MKLIRFGPRAQERPGIITDQGARKDCSSLVRDWDGQVLSRGMSPLAEMVDQHMAALDDVPDQARWAAPIARPGKVIGIGLNYRDHAEETGAAVPQEPVVFFKASNTVVGPYDTVLIPRRSEKTDWEVELGVVMGQEARYLDSPDQVDALIAGYCISNDVSERAFQIERGGQWDKGKSCDTFNPLGPWLASADELGAVGDLDMSLDLNDQRMQSGNTKTMVFDVPFIVYYLSQFMTLEPGDVITTGTPPGVGMGMNPPQYLKAGDVMELSIAGLGRQKQVCDNA